MGKVIGFSEFDSYYFSLTKTDHFPGVILDTNILISLSYEIKSNHEEVADFFERINQYEFQYFATVNTKSEFLDFHRRLLMTENLRDLVDPHSKWKIPTQAKAQIQVQSGQLTRREQQGSDPVFTDSQIKLIKSAFSAGRHSGQTGWLALCERILTNRLTEIEQLLLEYDGQWLRKSRNRPVLVFQTR